MMKRMFLVLCMGTILVASASAQTPIFNVNFESAAYTLGAAPDLDATHTPALDWNYVYNPDPNACTVLTTGTKMGSIGGTKSIEIVDPSGSAQVFVGESNCLAARAGGLGLQAGRLVCDVRPLGVKPTYVDIRLSNSATAFRAQGWIAFGFDGTNIFYNPVPVAGGTVIATAAITNDTTYRWTIEWDTRPIQFGGSAIVRLKSILKNPGNVGGTQTELLTAPFEYERPERPNPTGAVAFSFNTGFGTARSGDYQVDNIQVFDLAPPSAAKNWALYE